jgi:deferrochelatase/peroxidase EfeB
VQGGLALLSRRGLLQAALGGGATVAAERLLDASPAEARAAGGSSEIVPFYGRHQAGITTTPPNCLALAAFDLATSSAAAVRLLLRSWTDAAVRMSEGKLASAAHPGLASPPPDSGEALGAGPQHLTITVGFGPQLFDKLGMPHRRPAGLQPLPAMPGDQLDPKFSDGDVVVQACADGELVATHAVRQLIRISAPLLVPRWLQTGFGIAARAPQVTKTPRNLFGFKDGTANPVPGGAALRQALWIQAPDQPRWAHGGTFLAVRRIRTDLTLWDSDSLGEQQRAFGRVKGTGAPLTGGTEYTAPNFSAKRNGKLVIPRHAHIRVARPHAGEAPMLRRGCNFDDGLTADGQLDAGQLFLAFARDLQSQFVPALTRVMAGDELTKRYTTHVGSAVFVVPPGAPKGGYLGQTLFG